MNNHKKQFISIRVDAEEKAILDKKAESVCMTVSEYARHILLETNNPSQGNELEKNLRSTTHIKKMTRCILYTRYVVNALMDKSMDEKEVGEVYDKIEKAFKKYGIYELEG